MWSRLQVIATAEAPDLIPRKEPRNGELRRVEKCSWIMEQLHETTPSKNKRMEHSKEKQKI